MSTLAVIPQTNSMLPIIQLVQNSLTSANSKRAYGDALTAFLRWYDTNGRPGLNKATIQNYKAVLQDRGLSPSSINQHLSAIRKLADEAADNGLLDSTIAAGIAHVKGVKQAGIRVGYWLTREQAQALLEIPDFNTAKGLRDRAILAVMLGTGLRRSEVSALRFANLQQREGRWAIVDLLGKGNRVRTVPMPPWAKSALDAWIAEASRMQKGYWQGERLFRSINRGDCIIGESMTPQAIHNVVKEYAAKLGLQLAAHDLRRTFAKLAYQGGASLDQIQLSLGHASIKTTERYLGVQQNLQDAPCDHLGLRLEG